MHSKKPTGKSLAPRAERQTAFLSVFVRKYRRVPLFRVDAQLLDLTVQGCKLQFPIDVRAKPGSKFWLEIPLSHVQAGARGSKFFQGTCRWFNAQDFTLGATLREESGEARQLLEILVGTLKAAGRPSV